MRVAVIRYNTGNIYSMRLALERLGISPLVTDDAGEIRRADKVIFPGVGEARSAMAYLKAAGLDTTIRELIQPFLGVCLGLQLLCTHSQESDTPCLGIFTERVHRFPPQNKVPHMGWNTVDIGGHWLFDKLPANPYVYFVHSYYAETGPATIGRTEYIVPFSAALESGNYVAVQFHPEKSGSAGEQILRNFLHR